MTTQGISTKAAGGGVTAASLGLLYWLLFSTPWWPTIDPAPPAEIWLQFSALVTFGVSYWVPELAGKVENES